MVRDNTALRRAGAVRGMYAGAIALCAAAALLVPTAAGAGAATIVYEPVSETVFLHELDSGQVVAATINKRVRSVRVTLKDGTHVLAHYPAHEEPRTYALIKSKGVPVAVLTKAEAEAEEKAKPAKHKIRYIVGGVLIVVIVVVGTVLLINRRRRRREEEWPTGSSAPGTG
jgi:hypothetical protein